MRVPRSVPRRSPWLGIWCHVTFDFSPSGQLAVGALNGEISLIDLADPASPQVSARLSDAHVSLERLRSAPTALICWPRVWKADLWAWETNTRLPQR